jgi:hypothetical protein
MIAFIDAHRAVHGVEPICRVLPIAPSTYHAHAARRADPSKAPARSRSDAELSGAIRQVWDANFQVYGYARCGGSCGGRASMWRAARLPG